MDENSNSLDLLVQSPSGDTLTAELVVSSLTEAKFNGDQPNHQQNADIHISVAEAIVKILENLGVQYAFGVSGGAMAKLWGALSNSQIQVLHFRHEAGAAFASDIRAALEQALAASMPFVLLQM